MKNSKGFTLVEVLAALLVLGIAIGITMPMVNAVRARWAAKPAVEQMQPAAQRRWVNPTAPAAEPETSPTWLKNFSPAAWDEQVEKALESFIPEFYRGVKLTNPALAADLQSHDTELRNTIRSYLYAHPSAVRLFLMPIDKTTTSQKAAAFSHAIDIGKMVQTQPWFKPGS